MTWVSVNDRLPPPEKAVFVAGDYTPMDEQGRPLWGGFPKASRRCYEGVEWFWGSSYWRATAGVRWWWDGDE